MYLKYFIDSHINIILNNCKEGPSAPERNKISLPGTQPRKPGLSALIVDYLLCNGLAMGIVSLLWNAVNAIDFWGI